MPTILQYEVDVYGAAGKKMEKDDIDRLKALTLHYEDNHHQASSLSLRLFESWVSWRSVHAACM